MGCPGEFVRSGSLGACLEELMVSCSQQLLDRGEAEVILGSGPFRLGFSERPTLRRMLTAKIIAGSDAHARSRSVFFPSRRGVLRLEPDTSYTELISIKLGKPLDRIRQLERLHPRCLRTPPESSSSSHSHSFPLSTHFLPHNQIVSATSSTGSISPPPGRT